MFLALILFSLSAVFHTLLLDVFSDLSFCGTALQSLLQCLQALILQLLPL